MLSFSFPHEASGKIAFLMRQTLAVHIIVNFLNWKEPSHLKVTHRPKDGMILLEAVTIDLCNEDYILFYLLLM